MIRVKIFTNKDRLIGYSISGHSTYDEYGRDIICSAVSALGQTILISMKDVLKLKDKEFKYKVDDSGYLEFILTNLDNDQGQKSVELLIKTFIVGIESIIDSYPGYVTLSYREV